MWKIFLGNGGEGKRETPGEGWGGYEMIRPSIQKKGK